MHKMLSGSLACPGDFPPTDGVIDGNGLRVKCRGSRSR